MIRLPGSWLPWYLSLGSSQLLPAPEVKDGWHLLTPAHRRSCQQQELHHSPRPFFPQLLGCSRLCEYECVWEKKETINKSVRKQGKEQRRMIFLPSWGLDEKSARISFRKAMWYILYGAINSFTSPSYCINTVSALRLT